MYQHSTVIVELPAAAVALVERVAQSSSLSRASGHLLLLLLACAVTATATITPVRRAVDRALETLSIEEIATGEPALLRNSSDGVDAPFFPAPSEDFLAKMRPRATIVTHVVEPGDTINKLATHYNVTPQTIVWANHLLNPDRLPVGQALLVLPVSGVLHEVQPGETVESVALKYQIEPRAVADVNGLALDKQLGLADHVIVPGARPLEAERPEPTSRAIERPRASPPKPLAGEPARTSASVPQAIVQPPSAAPEAAQPAAVVEAIRPKALKPFDYQVGEGDTILAIARRFSLSPGTIVQANGIAGSAADSLRVGQNLTLLPVDGVIHKVAGGDTVRDVAGHYGVDTSAVIQANALDDPFVLRPGQVLVVPGGRVPDPLPVPEPAPALAAPSEPPALAYKVIPGDTVVTIAERFDVAAVTIAKYNGLDRADVIAPGQDLLIPGAKPPRAPAAGAALSRSAAPAVTSPAPAAQAQTPLQVAAAIVKPIVRSAAVVPAPAPKPVVAANNWSVVEVASRFLGYAYVWGGHSPKVGFDCTGFTWYVFGQAGRSIPQHDLWGQMQSGPRVSRNNLQAGDLVFFQNTYMPGLSHSGIYIGGNRFIHAGSERTGVTVSSMNDGYWGPRYYGATRPW